MKGKEKSRPISQHLANLPLAAGQASAPAPAPTPPQRMRGTGQHAVAVATPPAILWRGRETAG